MKRITTLTLLAALAACGGGDAPADAPADAAATPAVEAAPAAFDAQGAYNMVCATCHGATGAGDGIAGGALNPPAADFTDPAFWEARTDDVVFTAIKEGGPAVGKSPLMVGWAMSYDDDQIQALVEYVKTLGSE